MRESDGQKQKLPGKAKQMEPEGKSVTENIRLCPDGVYRWHYELNMLKNPTIILSVWKVLGVSFGAVFVLLLAIDLIDGTIRSAADLGRALMPFLILLAVFFVISIISYLILAAMYGWKYMVLFEMTEDYVRHIQMPRQFQKAQALGWLTMLSGRSAGKPAMAGLGLDVSARNTSVSEFKNVAVVKPRRRRNTIYVNQRLDRNQVYAGDADFDFVEKFILDHCVKAKVK